MVRFAAELVHVEDTGSGLIRVGFSNGRDEGDGREYLLFDRLYEVTAAGRKVAVGVVSVERNDQGGGGEGGVAEVEVRPDLVRVVLVGAVAEQAGAARYEIGLSLAAGEFERLRDGLRLVFAGYGCLVVSPVEPAAAPVGGGV